VCDTFAFIDADGAWFAKNSDRPPNEVQVVHSWPARVPGGRLRSQYLDLGVDPGAHALFAASQPTWLWGLEHGVNQHRIAIGNETVYTTADRWSPAPALLGMDLVRLALERAGTPDEALDVLTQLLSEHGQGGSGWEHANEPYFSSFLIVGATRAWVVETSQRSWVARRTDAGGVAISNRLTLSNEWDASSTDVAPRSDWQTRRDPKAPTGIADHRLDVTNACVSSTRSPTLTAITATLRDHGPTRPRLPQEVGADWSGVSVCMHVRAHQATTSSLVTRLPRDPNQPIRHWIALGSPCVSVYVPAFADAIPGELSSPNTWHRFERLRERVESDPTGIDALREIRAVLDPVEHELWTAADTMHADLRHTGSRHTGDATWSTSAFALVAAALTRLGV
jgi:dipeptidase